MKIAFIGGGNMAAALIGGLVRRGVAASELLAVDINEDARQRAQAQFGVRTAAAIDATLAGYDAIVLAVKPQVLKEIATALAPHLSTQLVVSIAAGIRGADLSRWLGDYARVVRTMPNTPALVGLGVTGLSALPGVDAAGRDLASKVLGAVGETVWFDDESQLDAVTAISGSGPAYVFYFIEALQEAARQLGMNDEQGRALAVATFAGAAQLAVQSGEPASVLRERVTSKGGTTAAALASFDAQHVKDSIVRGVLAAQARAKEMGDELGAA
ncbi:pyrroline-5-carboxylate reductase [Burkholderia thailandensis]|uniref:Pyrroline-5-carboxylate reductase n=1 Tax=Burkholderia thailandensis (strain ATCC 700388 / DSM 13276 / CCUG 48851 / CIP 106301 / E264) TaxID=271848 RepID=Q2SZ15_BURTA|nr:pyrroline-5-carboxylate reductase [Burkholderia thailandensis]ABC37673.1 pyrroline-5-carboxylate reductase [Burkholderia thailandensis E264]AIP24591.1 pyrroline-5-carboxylate reductase [Burkholderia thailandensis E264]AIS96151.1 pyrroline-5-carboxylate reductase [Burkholderia thailandensis MSMB59]AJX98436.1 pyrroline-5-carboxylate reductase [Burkholderia thailandensis 2002721643]AOJ46312.1 pyrroline-5-carboxylate reductase [Burkholderia thailandensis]